MSKLICVDCGHTFENNLVECPNCGCPASECKPHIERVSSDVQESETGQQREQESECSFDNGAPLNSTDVRECPSTAGYYLPWWNIFQPWYVSNDNPVEQHRFDELNEGLLLANLIFRVLLWWTLFFTITVLCFMTIILIPLGLYVIIKFFPWALARYWAKIHRLWRRMNQRYWISMESAKRTNHIEEI